MAWRVIEETQLTWKIHKRDILQDPRSFDADPDFLDQRPQRGLGVTRIGGDEWVELFEKLLLRMGVEIFSVVFLVSLFLLKQIFAPHAKHTKSVGLLAVFEGLFEKLRSCTRRLELGLVAKEGSEGTERRFRLAVELLLLLIVPVVLLLKVPGVVVLELAAQQLADGIDIEVFDSGSELLRLARERLLILRADVGAALPACHLRESAPFLHEAGVKTYRFGHAREAEQRVEQRALA